MSAFLLQWTEVTCAHLVFSPGDFSVVGELSRTRVVWTESTRVKPGNQSKSLLGAE